MSIMSEDQIKMLQSLVEALSGVKTMASSKKSAKSSSKKDSAPKKERKTSAWNEEVRKVYEEMQADYYSENPSAEGMTPEEIRSAAKKGELPPFPTYPQALAEASRRRCAADPEALKKHQAHREKREAHIAAKKAEKESQKGGKKSKSSTPPDSASESEAEDAESAASSPSPPPPPPVPKKSLPVKKVTAEKEEKKKEEPAAEAKKPRGRPKKVKTEAPAPPPEEEADPEKFNMVLNHEGQKYAMNKKGWVVNSEGDWVGIWDAAKKQLDTDAEPPQDA